MARLLEHTAKRLLADADVPVPRSIRVESVSAGVEAAARLGLPCVIKALVPGNRRGKAGAVRFAATIQEVEDACQSLLESTVGPFTVDALLIEERVEIQDEWYLALELASGEPAFTLLLSTHGGVDIEDRPEGVVRFTLDPNRLPDAEALAVFWRSAGIDDAADELGSISRQLLDLFVSHDLTLLEINPLARLSDGQVCCVGALMAVDDNALARQSDIRDEVVAGSDLAWRPETALEARASALAEDTSQRGSARYLELDGGDIGFLCGGGGASLLLFDAVVAAGGRPANYSEFGGNPTEQRVYDLTRIVLDKPGVRGLLLAHNLTNNTQVDVIASGVVRALADANLPQPFPVVAREAGLHDETARHVFESAGISYFGEETTLDTAATQIVTAMKRSRR